MLRIATVALALGAVTAFTAPRRAAPSMAAEVSRQGALTRAVLGGAALLTATTAGVPAAMAASETTTASGLTYSVLQAGKGSPAEMGDIVCVRFLGKYKDVVIDNIMEAPEPYFYRVGSGTLLPGIEEAIKMMHVGDRWALTLPGPIAFGKNGKRASPGKPSIPPMATLNYEVFLESIPGKDEEVILLDDV